MPVPTPANPLPHLTPSESKTWISVGRSASTLVVLFFRIRPHRQVPGELIPFRK